MKITNKHILFWNGIFSNFEHCHIDNEYGEFYTSEQYFMYRKALFFKCDDIAELIYNEMKPGKCKEHGRKIPNFNASKWSKVSESIMEDAVYCKFSQNRELYDELISPKYDGKKFVEASPFDDIWGIKLGEENPDADDETKWRGLNLLGKVIDKVRLKLLNQ